MKRTDWMVFILTTAFAVSPCLAQVQDGEEQAVNETNVPVSEGAFPGGVSVDVGEGLSLTDEQKEKAYQLKSQLMDNLGPKRLELKKQQRQLKDLLSQASLNRVAIKDTQEKINSLRNEISNSVVDFRVSFAEQLTPEQRKTMRYRKMGRHQGARKHDRRPLKREIG